MKKCFEDFNKLGIKRVLLKGGHMFEKKNIITDILFNKGEITEFEKKRIKTFNTHGTGCSLASAITANLFQGKTLKNSVRNSINYVHTGIKKSFLIGHGHNPINHFINIIS